MMDDWLLLYPGYHPYPALEFSYWLADAQALTDVEIEGFDEFQKDVEY
jgi:hypothetical protein